MVMKNRAECLAEYGSDYMILQKVNSGELLKSARQSTLKKRLFLKLLYQLSGIQRLS